MHTRDKGPFRILIEDPTPDGLNQYFKVEFYFQGQTKSEIVWVKDSRIAYNNAIRKHGKNLLNVYNLESGHMVVGGR